MHDWHRSQKAFAQMAGSEEPEIPAKPLNEPEVDPGRDTPELPPQDPEEVPPTKPKQPEITPDQPQQPEIAPPQPDQPEVG